MSLSDLCTEFKEINFVYICLGCHHLVMHTANQGFRWQWLTYLLKVTPSQTTHLENINKY